MNYDELNRFTGSLTYSIQRRFIFFCHSPKGVHGTMPWPKYATAYIFHTKRAKEVSALPYTTIHSMHITG